MGNPILCLSCADEPTREQQKPQASVSHYPKSGETYVALPQGRVYAAFA